MNNDRELLELAAKATGIEFHIDNLDACPNLVANGRVWHPLNDDGDALRLAVKLKLCVSIDFDRVDVTTPQMDNATEYFYDNPPTDPYAATRRAIVRAAAEIGKGMV